MKGKKEEVLTVDGDQFRYFLLAGSTNLYSNIAVVLLEDIALLIELSLKKSSPNESKGTSHPYPDDTFYSVGRVPRKLLMK